MAEMTFDEVYEAAKRLPPEQQEALIQRLRTAEELAQTGIKSLIPVLNLGEWQGGEALRREDLYGDGGL